MTWFNDILSSLRIWNKGHDYMVPVVSSVGNGAKGDKGDQGPKGDKGDKGDQGIQGIQGIGIRSIVQTIKSRADNGINKIRITLTNGDTSDIEIKNGAKGSTFTFNDLTAYQINQLKTGVATVYYSKIEETITPGSTVSSLSLPEGIDEYCVIAIDVNGLDIIDGVDYEIDFADRIISFTPSITAGSLIHFFALKSIAVTPEDYNLLKGDKGDKGDQGIQGPKGDKGDTGANIGDVSIGEGLYTSDNTLFTDVDNTDLINRDSSFLLSTDDILQIFRIGGIPGDFVTDVSETQISTDPSVTYKWQTVFTFQLINPLTGSAVDLTKNHLEVSEDASGIGVRRRLNQKMYIENSTSIDDAILFRIKNSGLNKKTSSSWSLTIETSKQIGWTTPNDVRELLELEVYIWDPDEGEEVEFHCCDVGDLNWVFGLKKIDDHNVASGQYSHAEGFNTIASGNYSHAEGGNTNASGTSSHAENANTEASGTCSHAEGTHTTASGLYSHAEGDHTIASGGASHAQNSHTIASSANQTVIGKYNIEDTQNKYAFIIGNGTDDDHRSNALAIKWDGEIVTSNF